MYAYIYIYIYVYVIVLGGERRGGLGWCSGRRFKRAFKVFQPQMAIMESLGMFPIAALGTTKNTTNGQPFAPSMPVNAPPLSVSPSVNVHHKITNGNDDKLAIAIQMDAPSLPATVLELDENDKTHFISASRHNNTSCTCALLIPPLLIFPGGHRRV